MTGMTLLNLRKHSIMLHYISLINKQGGYIAGVTDTAYCFFFFAGGPRRFHPVCICWQHLLHAYTL